MKNMRIWKEVLTPETHQALSLPAGEKLLDVQMQGDNCCLWFLCNVSARVELRRIAIYETGSSLPDDPGEYIATFQSGDYVFHVFEAGDE